MKSRTLLLILSIVCAAVPAVAQTVSPNDMVQIPAGKFWMGRDFAIFVDSGDFVARDKMDDRPANHVYVDAFSIDKYEVTNADYAKFVQAKGVKPPWHWPQGKIPMGQEKFPVANVNWFEATEYCNWLGKRLPTEAEWEKAGRGGLDRAHYTWGDDTIDKETEEGLLSPQSTFRNTNTAVPGTLGRPWSNAVATFEPNAYGLYDMTGNVMEWTNDWYDNNYYPFMPKNNPKGPEKGRYRVVRGAGYADQGGHGIEKLVSYRNFSDPDTRMTTIGFRCAK